MVVFFFALALALAFNPLSFRDQVNDGKLTSGISEHSKHIKYSKDQLERAIKEGPVFVNFTAAWCVTCKVNEIGALNSKRIAGTFNEKELTYMVADWTNEDPQITEALERYGRAGVPLYLLFAKNSLSPVVLPQILTIDVLLSALDKI
jgi:thiol:disulfide interchange protein DsbD